MSTMRVSALLAAFAFVASPALARTTSTRQPTTDDARQLQAVERYADELATGTAADNDRYTVLDKIDVAWNSVSNVYIPLDARARFSGAQAEPFTVMQERMSVLNSTVADDSGVRASAKAVAESARRLLQKTGAER